MLADSLEKHYSFLCGGTEKASLRYHPDWPEMTSEEILIAWRRIANGTGSWE